MFEAVRRPTPCGIIIGIDPSIPVLGFGLLGLTEVTSKLTGGVCGVDCASRLARPMPQHRAHRHTTYTIFFIRSVLLSHGRESSAAEVARRERALHRVLALDCPGVLQSDLCSLHAG